MTDHTPPTSAELAEIRERSDLSCGDRNHGNCDLPEDEPGPGCEVCAADVAAIGDRAILLAEIDSLRSDLQLAQIAALRREDEIDRWRRDFHTADEMLRRIEAVCAGAGVQTTDAQGATDSAEEFVKELVQQRDDARGELHRLRSGMDVQADGDV